MRPPGIVVALACGTTLERIREAPYDEAGEAVNEEERSFPGDRERDGALPYKKTSEGRRGVTAIERAQIRTYEDCRRVEARTTAGPGSALRP